MTPLECNRCGVKVYPPAMFVASIADRDGYEFAYLTRRFSPGLQWMLRVFTYFRYSESSPKDSSR